MTHSQLVNKTVLTVGSSGVAICWKNPTGLAERNGRIIKFGFNGSPDIIGFTNQGIFLGIECKTGNAVQSKHQKSFERAVNKFNAIYIVCRENTTILDLIREAKSY